MMAYTPILYVYVASGLSTLEIQGIQPDRQEQGFLNHIRTQHPDRL
jgi:hypothetical protein